MCGLGRLISCLKSLEPYDRERRASADGVTVLVLPNVAVPKSLLGEYAQPEPLNDLMVQCVESPGPRYVRSWDFFETDLNAGKGRQCIYVGYKKGFDLPVTSIRFEAYDSAQKRSLPGWEWSPVDLSCGAGGKYVYLYWKRGEAQKRPIVNLMFLATADAQPPEIPGWHQVGCDLRKGASGLYVWAYCSHDIPA